MPAATQRFFISPSRQVFTMFQNGFFPKTLGRAGGQGLDPDDDYKQALLKAEPRGHGVGQ